ncbi:hypothetical protein CWE13_11165 [Aliidiomarina shirensis]|uniref:HTH cro/C1-type domain-containing protein n=1 Tax=Aliidiomarina shirensis TaxID=1048642 RepID=A0A432WNV2_9GAMM|nr:helix-turn-helix transcriptional regulator [Aliidiomarina shirensis]RUO35482.1 hypothetical protein CWE13_11165 [Aliidiomarina shirensis]
MISAEKVKYLRQQLGWSQEQLALVSGVSARTIQRIEKSGECSLESKMALASALNVSVSELIDDEERGKTMHHMGWGRWLSWLVLLLIVGYYFYEASFFGKVVSARYQVMIPLLIVFVGLFAGFKSTFELLKTTFTRQSKVAEYDIYRALRTSVKLMQAVYVAALITALLVSMSSFEFLNIMNTWASISRNIVYPVLCAIFLVEIIIRPIKITLERRLG